MQPYKFTVRYIPVSKNIADVLSRLVKSDQNKKMEEITDEYVKFVAQESTPSATTTREIERESASDSELKAIRECLINQQWHKLEYKEYLPIRGELCAIGMLVLRGTRIVIPEHMRDRVLEIAHEGHPGIVSMKSRLRCSMVAGNR